jgi:hypothetical protein
MPVHVRKHSRHTTGGKTVPVRAHTRVGDKKRLPKSEAASLVSGKYKPTSSFLKEVSYDKKFKTLTVNIGKRVYKYHGVPLHEYEGLVKASSSGSYFATHIKKYTFTKK